MLTAEAHVRTDRPSRYLVQLCRHAGHMRRRPHQPRTHDTVAPPEVRHVEWSDTAGTVVLNWGRWTLEAARNTLTLRAEAANNDDLQRIQDLLTQRIEKIGRRDHLTVTWQRPDTSTTAQAHAAVESRHSGKSARNRRTGGVLVAVVAVFIAVHLGLGGAALAASSWAGIGLATILVLKIIVLRMFATRRHRFFSAVRKVVGGR